VAAAARLRRRGVLDTSVKPLALAVTHCGTSEASGSAAASDSL